MYDGAGQAGTARQFPDPVQPFGRPAHQDLQFEALVQQPVAPHRPRGRPGAANLPWQPDKPFLLLLGLRSDILSVVPGCRPVRHGFALVGYPMILGKVPATERNVPSRIKFRRGRGPCVRSMAEFDDPASGPHGEVDPGAAQGRTGTPSIGSTGQWPRRRRVRVFPAYGGSATPAQTVPTQKELRCDCFQA